MPLAIITGASSGIGKDLARLCAQAGYDTLLVARSEQALTSLAAEISTSTKTTSYVLRADLSDRSSPDRIAEEARRIGQPIQILINNAGYGDLAAFARASWEKLSDLMDLNMWTAVRLTYLLLPDLRTAGAGRIMFVSSTAAFQPVPYFATYAAAKSFVLDFGQALAQELHEEGISVTVLCPGSTETGFHKASGTGNGLVDRYMGMESYPVAKAGFKGMMKGRRVIVPGLFNKLNFAGIRFIPARIAAWLAAFVMRPDR